MCADSYLTCNLVQNPTVFVRLNFLDQYVLILPPNIALSTLSTESTIALFHTRKSVRRMTSIKYIERDKEYV